MAGGSWIAVQSDGRAACLLNGAYEPYQMGILTKQSRGVMLLDLFNYSNTEQFVREWAFHSVAPFTMIVLDGTILTEIIWDGKDINSKAIIDDHKIWSSVQLYTEATRKDKRERFEHWIGEQRMNNPSQQDIMYFHQTGHPDFLIANDRVQTISVSSVSINPKSEITFEHLDLISKKSSQLKWAKGLPDDNTRSLNSS
jgi:hypothetical protein